MSEHGPVTRSTPDAPEVPETDGEIRYGMLLQLGFGLLALVLVSAALVYFLYAGLLEWEEGRQPEPPVLEEARAASPVPGALLLPERGADGRPGRTPEQHLDDHDREAEKRLTTYGWVDEERGVAHLPIERAMELVAGQGLGESAPDPDGAATPPVPPESGEGQAVIGAEDGEPR